MKIAIIGGGAAGMFCAANIESKDAEVIVLESGRELLRKVEQSGGGRCNITNAEPDLEKFIKNYPRGGGRLRKPLRRFGANDLLEWFNQRGVKFTTEKDGRVFPQSEESLEVVRCLKRECQRSGVNFRMPFTATEIGRQNGAFIITGRHGDTLEADKVVFAGGGRWNEGLKSSLEKFGHSFAEERPSLFPFKTNFKRLTELAGITFKSAALRYSPCGFETAGDVLVTHEGLSGPAVLKMSSLGAREFYDREYRFEIELASIPNPADFKAFCEDARIAHSKKLVRNFHPAQTPQAFWNFALEKSIIPSERTWAQFSADEQKRLAQMVCSLPVQITGRAANAREFVSCGGLNLNEVDFTSMQSKCDDGLFFAGECLDIDGFTGGYNLQSAWTTGKIAADALSLK